MKQYQKTAIKKVSAYQFKGKEDKLVKRIMYDDIGGIIESPIDPIRQVYFAIKQNNEWKHIQIGDWIVEKSNKILVVKDDIFQLLYDEV